MRNLVDRHRIKGPARALEFSGLRTPQLHRPPATADQSEPLLLAERCTCEEVLIADARASLRPAELVERKLISLLKSVYLPVSHVRTTSLCKGRGPTAGDSSQRDYKVNTTFSAHSTPLRTEGHAVAPVCCP